MENLAEYIQVGCGTTEIGHDLPPGIYFLKVDGKYIGKVVKVR